MAAQVQADAALLAKLDAAACDWAPLKGLSAPGREFCFKCLRPKVQQRWSADEALQFCINAWREALRRPPPLAATPPRPPSNRRPSTGSPRLAPELESSIKRFGSYSELRKAALLVAAARTDHRRADKLRRAFLDADTEATGTLNEAELCAALGVEGLNEASKQLFKTLDHDGSGAIHYDEFLAATLESEAGLLDTETLQATFDRMDADDSGAISPANIRALLGTRASDELVDRMIADGDLKRNGVVDFDEFAAVMTGTEVVVADG